VIGFSRRSSLKIDASLCAGALVELGWFIGAGGSVSRGLGSSDGAGAAGRGASTTSDWGGAGFFSTLAARLICFARACAGRLDVRGGGALRFCRGSTGVVSSKKETEIRSIIGVAEKGLRQSRGTRAKCNASEREKKQG
jgi:hypothetical protein